MNGAGTRKLPNAWNGLASRPEEGFTLLEFLIAFTLLALMGAAMFSTFRVALNSYQVSQGRLEKNARTRVMEDYMRRQVGSIYPLVPQAAFQESEFQEGTDFVPPEAMVSQIPLFYGTDESMTFVTLAPFQMLRNPGLTVVRYGRAEDEWGRPYFGAMETRFDGIGSFQMMVNVPAGKPLAILEGVKQLHFEYYGYDGESQAYRWFPEWSGEIMQQIPSAVRISADEQQVVMAINTSVLGNAARQRLLGNARAQRAARARAIQAMAQEQ